MEVCGPVTSSSSSIDADIEQALPSALVMNTINKHESDSDADEGPQPLPNHASNLMKNHDNNMNYGRDLMAGEGQAIAQFVQKNMRIPRRGEIGWDGKEIESLENQGYVMSGSRHQRMNAVRLRKENQVYTAEEKRALALLALEEKQVKDAKIVGDFKSMLQQRLKSHDDNEEEEQSKEEQEERNK